MSERAAGHASGKQDQQLWYWVLLGKKVYAFSGLLVRQCSTGTDLSHFACVACCYLLGMCEVNVHVEVGVVSAFLCSYLMCMHVEFNTINWSTSVNCKLCIRVQCCNGNVNAIKEKPRQSFEVWPSNGLESSWWIRAFWSVTFVTNAAGVDHVYTGLWTGRRSYMVRIQRVDLLRIRF